MAAQMRVFVSGLAWTAHAVPAGGSHVDPAGRSAPMYRQESWGATKPVYPPRAPGYTGYVPGKVSEGVFGERQNITDYVCQHREKKNRSENLQR